MKKHKGTLFLVIGVVVIYVLIIVRFFILKNEGAIDVKTSNVEKAFMSGDIDVAKEFTIYNNYRDPFLKTYKPKKKKSTENTNIKVRKKEEKKDTLNFPPVNYKGLVSDVNGNQKVFAIVIKGYEYLMSVGSIIDGVEVLEGSSRKIKIRFENKEKTITIN